MGYKEEAYHDGLWVQLPCEPTSVDPNFYGDLEKYGCWPVVE
jgi:hypothetical protein